LPPGAFIRDLQVNAVLGSGANGVTYQVSDTAIGTQFALKEYLPAKHVSRRGDGTLSARNPASGKSFKEGLERFLYRRPPAG